LQSAVVECVCAIRLFAFLCGPISHTVGLGIALIRLFSRLSPGNCEKIDAGTREKDRVFGAISLISIGLGTLRWRAFLLFSL
jgi:hypothetical protein